MKLLVLAVEGTPDAALIGAVAAAGYEVSGL